MGWLPTTAKEVKALGWDYIDVILISGDAYIDHPSFGVAVIGRTLEAAGYRVAVIPQPNWRDDLRDFKKLGAPRLFFGVSAGSMDSMVNHYTANIRLRSDDAYTPGGKAGFRPDYAVTVYSKILKELYPNVPVVIGGIEASLRRLTHYDYWSNSLKPSVLIESGADLLMYGMGDKSITEVAKALHNGFNAKLLRRLRQVAFVADQSYVERLPEEQTLRLNSFEECVASGRAFGENFKQIEVESNLREQTRTIVEAVGERYVVVTPPYTTLTQEELDRSFDLPYMRAPHPRYNGKGDIPAWEMIKNSINIHRGCFGGCSFCTISAHQGKFISSRSEESILREVRRLTEMPYFRGNISDIGGPSANMYRMGGRDTSLCAKCRRPSCLHPKPCPNLTRDHSHIIELYRKITAVQGVRHAYIGSGIRYDLFDGSLDYLREVVVNHTSGRLKVAPEHTEDHILKLMRKPSFDGFVKLKRDFERICADAGLKYQVIPYFISSHPGCTERDMAALAAKTRSLGMHLEQVQDLTPTPMTLSSVMFHTGENPYTGEKLYVARNQDDKRRQKSYFFDGPSKSPAPQKRGAHQAANRPSNQGPNRSGTYSSNRSTARGDRPLRGRKR